METAELTTQYDITNFLTELTYEHARALADAELNPSIFKTVRQLVAIHRVVEKANRLHQKGRRKEATEALETGKELFSKIRPWGV